MRLYIVARKPSTANQLTEWQLLGVFDTVDAAIAASTTADDVIGEVQLGQIGAWSPVLASLAPATVTWEVVRVHRTLGIERVLASGLARTDALSTAETEGDDDETVVLVRPAGMKAVDGISSIPGPPEDVTAAPETGEA